MNLDFLKQAGGVLAAIAPTVATVMGGPLAGMATTAVINALGLAPDASKEQVMQAIAGATPEQMLKLKEVEAQLILDLKKLDVDLVKISADNTKDARAREIATKDWTPRVLAFAIMALYIGVQAYVLGYVVPEASINIVMRSLGTLDAAVGLVLGYYFGSSVGSASKTDQISTMINGKK
jgi:hypothetical protein